jgi:UDP-glucose 6-dehydrogenase
MGADWGVIEDALGVDPMISNRYAHPIHKSGRGAGGHCFIKDFRALREVYSRTLPEDVTGADTFKALEEKNLDLLITSGKDHDLVEGVYGKDVLNLKDQ